MSETQPKCPVCGATTDAHDVPFENKKSVVAHMRASTGEHRGIGDKRARSLLEGDGDATKHMDAGSDDVAAETAETTSEDSDGEPTGDTDPSKQAPDVGADVATKETPDDDGDDDPLDDIDGCPDCGSELIDFREHETYTTDDGRMLDTPDDFYCSNSECAKGWNL